MPPPYGWSAPPSMPYGAPGYMPLPGYDGYGQPLPPGVPYAAPPTYPLPAGAPPSMPYGTPYPGYPAGAPFPGYPGGMPPGPPPTPPKRRVGLIVGISVAAVLLVIVASCSALYAFVPQIRSALAGASAIPTTSAPTATATPSKTILYQNTFTSEAADWGNDTNCFLGTGGYHVKDGYICNAPVGVQINTDVTVGVKQASGATNEPYGIALRITRSPFSDYEFDVDALGHWTFLRCDANTCDHLVDFSVAASIHGGLNTTNTLEINATGSHFDFFINGTKIGQANDATYPSGLVGLAGAYQGECVFSNLIIAEPS